MGAACVSQSRSPSPVYGRSGVILKRPPSVTSQELRREMMKAEVEGARTKQRMAEDLRREWEADKEKLQAEIRREFQQEKEKLKADADKQRVEQERGLQYGEPHTMILQHSNLLLIILSS